MIFLMTVKQIVAWYFGKPICGTNRYIYLVMVYHFVVIYTGICIKIEIIFIILEIVEFKHWKFIIIEDYVIILLANILYACK